MDPRYFWKLDPDSKALEAQNRVVEGRGRSQWSLYRLVIANSDHFEAEEELEPDPHWNEKLDPDPY
jgi:hypothetical protein